MRKRIVRIMLILLLLCGMVARPCHAQSAAYVEASAREFVEPAVKSGTLAGIAVGLARRASGDSESWHSLVFGLAGGPDSGMQVCNADTIFEIGSVTKLFTALLLAEMATRGEVKLDDPVQQYLPDDVHVPTRDGRPIRLVDLATHSSGLPRMPNNFKPQDPANPYADYDPQRLYAFLNEYQLRHAPGQRVAYSNLGMGLLGHALARAAGVSIEKLINDRIATPLGMSDTVFVLSSQQQPRLAAGHDADGSAVGNWELNVLAGAGGLRSCVRDLLKFASAQLSPGQSPLEQAIKLTHLPRTRMKNSPIEIALGWHISNGVYWHNGQTGGYHGFIGFAPHEGVAAVALSNTASSLVDEIGMSLVKLAVGKAVEPLKVHTVRPVPTEILDRYVGRYDLEGATLTITRDEERLFAQLTFQAQARIWPASEREFFYRVVDAQITFDVDERGDTTGLVLHQNGRDIKARKLD